MLANKKCFITHQVVFWFFFKASFPMEGFHCRGQLAIGVISGKPMNCKNNNKGFYKSFYVDKIGKNPHLGGIYKDTLALPLYLLFPIIGFTPQLLVSS